MNDDEKRIDELESRLAFQDQALHELNEALVSQQRQLDRVTRVLEHTRRQLESLASQELDDTPVQLPPHY